ncbi:Choline transporter-like protein 1 [Lamellibrachia satsuma]|nr:Choline transporter-like protein 1 [Lamellibrachia satsuma]
MAVCNDCCCCDDSESTSQDWQDSGPTKRAVCCTDILFLIIFIFFIGGMLFFAVFSIKQGDSMRLIHGYDSFGNTCNQKNGPIPNITHSGFNTEGKSNVFFMSMWNPFKSMQLCVNTCPDKDLYTKEDVKEFAERTGSRLCLYDLPIDKYTNSSTEYSRNGPCPKLPIYKSLSLVFRCVPDPRAIAKHIDEKANITSAFLKILNSDGIFRKVLSDVYVSWKEMLALCCIALGVSFVMVMLIRYIASVIVWVIVALAAIGSIVGTAFLWWTYAQERTEVASNNKFHFPILDIDVKNETAFLGFSITATVLTVILLLVIIVMRSRLVLVVALFHEAGKCLVDLPLLLLQPFWTFLILMLFFVYWIIIYAYISTAGAAEANYEKDFRSVIYKKSDLVRYMWWYHLIGLIWISEFILACQQFIIANTVASWYFTRDKSHLGNPISKSICHLILHHIGSVALGSFIITLVKIPRYILMYIKSKLKNAENDCAKCCLKCCICCLWCLEKFLKYLNLNAYTIIAIEGKSFCPAAKKAFEIIASNALRVAAINSVGDFVLFLGKIGVMAITCAISVIWFKNIPALHYYAVPVILVCIFSFLIAHCFLTVYEMVIDTLLLCFCEDTQMNDGTDGRSYYMGSSLMGYVQSSSETLDRAFSADCCVNDEYVKKTNHALSPRNTPATDTELQQYTPVRGKR